MTENDPYGLTISFECPVCSEEVTMTETPQHNLHTESESHQPNLPWKGNEDRCNVHFSRSERYIRERYDFIEYEVPLIFAEVPESVDDEDVLEAAIDGMEEQNIGVCVKVSQHDDRTGFVYAWYHSNQPLYYAVTAGINTPQNVLASGSKDELREMLHKWFTWEPDEN